MPSINPGKARFVFSDTDMLCALEVHVPSIRAIHSSLSPLMRVVADWETDELHAVDSRIKRNFKSALAEINFAFSTAAISRAKAKRLDEVEFGVDISLCTLIELNWGMHMLLRSIQDVQASYETIYQALCSRIAGRQPQCNQLDELHHRYGSLTQARLRLTDRLEAMNAAVTNLAEHRPGMNQATEAALEAFAACTDVRDFLMLLKDAHQNGFEFARRPF